MENDIWKEYDKKEDISIPNGLGVVYVAEYEGCIKIGATSNINRRYKELSHQAVDYFNTIIGNVFYSIPHDNFLKNEKRIHDLLSEYRKEKTELFFLSLNDFFILIKDFIFDLDKKKDNCNIEIFKSILLNEHSNILREDTEENVDKKFKNIYCPHCSIDEFNSIKKIMSLLNTSYNSKTYSLYLITKIQNIIFKSNEKYLKTIC